MKYAYPVLFEQSGKKYVVTIPDLDIGTQGETLEEAIFMARDAISSWICFEQDMNRDFPMPSKISQIKAQEPIIVSLVDVDIDSYRRQNSTQSVRRNVTLPHWMDERAKLDGLNVSQILQEALKSQFLNN